MTTCIQLQTILMKFSHSSFCTNSFPVCPCSSSRFLFTHSTIQHILIATTSMAFLLVGIFALTVFFLFGSFLVYVHFLILVVVVRLKNVKRKQVELRRGEKKYTPLSIWTNLLINLSFVSPYLVAVPIEYLCPNKSVHFMFQHRYEWAFYLRFSGFYTIYTHYPIRPGVLRSEKSFSNIQLEVLNRANVHLDKYDAQPLDSSG